MNKDKLIIDGKDYGNDYIAYNRHYNNNVMEYLRMKQLNEIPIRQRKRRPIKRYRTNDFSTKSERIHTILAYVFAYLFGFILFLYAFISLISF
mgnify:FL=1